MASYQSGFAPPTRPGETSRGKRLGQYMIPSQAKQEHREADIAHISGQMEERRGYGPVSRQLQAGLPRPNLRSPSPSSRPEAQKPGTASRFGFGRAASKTRADPPELRGKSSRNVLRRKPSSIAQNTESPRAPMDRSISSSPTKWAPSHAEKRPSIDASLRSAEAYNEIFTRTRARAPPAKEPPRIIPELDRYRSIPDQSVSNNKLAAEVPHKLSTQDLPPPTPLLSGTPIYYSGGSSHHRYSGYSGSGYSGSPSTRFSESPGPGAYSRDTTPTSMSSMSPGIIAPLKTPSRVRQGSPAVNRPPVTMRGRSGSSANESEAPTADPQGLTPLRESLTSSSSNSTVKGDGKPKEKSAEKKKKKRLSPLPPSPPPRKSSQKFKKNRPEEQESPSKPSQAPAKPVMVSPELSPPTKPRTAPLHVRQKSNPQSNPPPRPSREGAPDLRSQLQHNMTPIIQSNLDIVSFSDRRRSALPKITASSPLHTQLPSPAFRRPSAGSPSPVITSPREGTPAPSGLGIIPNLRPPTKSATSTGTRTPSPSVSSSKPRFGLFGRRTKTAPEIPTIDKVARKGPAAGTGHEGYGRYAVRGRSSSAGGLGRGRDRSMSGASSSQESLASRTHDPFLLERMSPVIIAGGGDIVENRNASSELSRSESNTSISLVPASVPSSNNPSLSHEVARTTLWPSALPRDPPKRQSAIALPKGRRPSDSSDDGIGKSSLAFRRSMQRLNNSASALHLPRPLNISKISGPGSMTSLDASIMSDESQADIQVEVGRGRKGIITKPKKLEKRPKSPRKWNFFHRSQPKTETPAALQVTVGKPAAKSIPHYALLDSSDEQQDPVGIPDLEDILRDADVISLSNEELDLLQFGERRETIETMPEVEVAPEEQPPPVIFTSPEPMTPEPPKTDLHLVKETAPTRPSRLPQVGRIPKVISARPEATSPKSFSRPFARLSTIQPVQVPLASIDKDSVAVGPSPEKPSTPEPFPIARKDDRQSSADSKTDSTSASHRDFLAFSPRKNSEATTSSSGGLSFAGTTAVIPEPDAALVEDEVWDEYDDLIENPHNGDNDDTIKVPTSATSSHGGPFQYESYESRRVRKSKIQPPKESPTVTQFPLIMEPKPKPEPERQSAMTTSSTYSADMAARMKDLLTTVQTPTTPMSFTDFFAGYGDRNSTTPGSSARKPWDRNSNSNSPPERDSNTSSHSRSVSANAMIAIPEQERERREESPISQVNLRVGSMTVSKWLTFGHVLFSPAREEIIASSPSSSKTHSILVIDGLGNDDWSFYASETYPHSTFYNLSPTRPISPSTAPSQPHSSIQTPPNHRQVHYPSPAQKFPFPSSTFALVVFRFPLALPATSYANIISESKRVLKPGGFLEMAMLDVDMLSMGPKSRRAVRALKLRLQTTDPALVIGSASDVILKSVGKRGFTAVKSCNVGVPVASAIPSPAERAARSSGKLSQELSLTDLLRTPSNATDKGGSESEADANITKMVAKVGRFWYTRCYESVVGAGGRGRSIFEDQALLQECEAWNSSFKLVVAYAQKPVQGRRRTNSV
ncbi:hypothetical protein N431DRAFT_451443 [Stipitochalara longipes BDJ]|nr:hypothetical protein N431DRAFT_451443 [Stipitochalara longipes BDJ]